jgi:thiol-disulfide isomerase/thioredoxin
MLLSDFVRRWLPRLAVVALLFATGPAFVRGDDADPADPAAGDEYRFPGRFDAPELDGGVEWLNTTGEISMRELRGKVVILDFWTYCCINCIHVLPDLKYLEDKYRDQLVVIGVHAPKFDNEKDTENIREAILRYEIEHPVINDARMTVARKYAFSSWPTLVVIDPEGKFVGHTSGEGQRDLLDFVVGEIVTHHRAKGTLDETPVSFGLERERVQPGPLRYPGKIVTDEVGGRLFISDSNHNRIVIATLDGQLLDVVGTGAIGSRDGSYDAAEFDHPQGMALVGDTLYVADTENHLLRVVDLNTKQVGTLAGTGEQARGREPGGRLREIALNSPWDLTVLDGTLYIAMAGPHQLWKHQIRSDIVEVFAGSGREDILDGVLSAAALAQPSGITHDGEFLYHVDSEGSAVRKVSVGEAGEVKTLVGPHEFARGGSLFEFGDIDGMADTVRMQHPLGIVRFADKLFVADTYNHKIKLVDIPLRKATSWLGTGERGNGLDPLQLNEPAGLAIAGGLLYIADTNNHRLLVADMQTKAVRELVIAGLTPPAPPSDAGGALVSLEPIAQPATTIRAGQPLRIALQFQLPEGFKLNPLSTVIWQVDPVDSSALVAAEFTGQKFEATGDTTSATLEVPLAAEGAGTYDLSVIYQYCRDGSGGICKLGRTKLRLPLTTSPEGAAEPVTITIKAE